MPPIAAVLLDEGKTDRIPVKTVSTFTQPQTKQVVRNEQSGATVLKEGENAPGTPPSHRVYRRYWYAPSLGWYVRHEVVMTGPTINQRNEYVAAKVTPEKRAQSR